MMRIYIAVFLLFLLALPVVLADTAILRINVPTEREDNTPLPIEEMAGYSFHYADDFTEVFPNMILISGVQTTVTLPQAALGRTIVVVAIDTDGRTSVPSQPVAVPIGKTSPRAPTIIIIFNVESSDYQ